jgi:hypothetical protein
MKMLETFNIGNLRVGGYLGHALYAAVAARKMIGLSLVGLMATGLFALGAVRGVHAYLNYELRSPIGKSMFVVEDIHDDGLDLVVRHGTDHVRLHCAGSQQWSDTWKHLDHSYGCIPLKEGDVIKLEHWENDYILKLDRGQENDYHEGSY